ncbi:MAG: hypothetical protein MN733_24295 [Nitrososphaera sp.]|nr:hypothetical protein [Nitrososphaera sp.]
MNVAIYVCQVILITTLCWLPLVGYASDSTPSERDKQTLKHVEEAIKHAQEAGEAGRTAELVEHASEARQLAKENPDAFSPVRLERALERLDDAIKSGQQGHTDAANAALHDAESVLEILDRPGGCPEGPPCPKEYPDRPGGCPNGPPCPKEYPDRAK